MKLLFWVSLAVTVCVLGFYSDSRSCHQDETFIIWFTDVSWAQLFTNFRKEPFPPFYHILVKLWMGLFGYTEVALRSFSGVCFLATFGVTWWLGRRLFRRAELGTIFVAMIAAKNITWDAVYGRMYELLYLESCVALLAFVGLFSGRAPRKAWAVILFAANLAGMMTHYYFAFFLLAEGLAFLLFYRRRSWLLFIACAVVPTVLFAVSWGPMLRSQLASGQFGPGGVGGRLPWSTGLSVVRTYFGTSRALIILALLVFLALVDRRRGGWRVRSLPELRSRGRRLARDPRLRVFGLFWAVVLAAPIGVAAVKGAGFYRGLPVALLSVLPAMILLSLLAGRCDRRLRLTIGLAALAFVMAIEVRGRHKVLNDPTDNRSAIMGLLRQTSEDDAIVYFVNQCTLFPYYIGRAPGDRKPRQLVFPEDQFEHGGWYNEDLQLGDPARRSEALEAFGHRVADHLKRHPGARAWVVQDIWETKLTGEVNRELDGVLRRVGHVATKSDNFDGFVVYESRAEVAGKKP